jgi:hypothetical protein
MRHLLKLNPKLTLLMMLTLALSLTLVGCSDDDDDNNNPTNPGGVAEFDQAFAAQQAQMMVPLVIDMVENMTLYAGGIDVAGKADDIYEWAWNPANGRWEGAYVSSGEGMTISYSGWLQYLDEMGTPQQSADGAEAFAYQNTLNLVSAFVGDGTSVNIDMDTEESFSASGLNTSTILVSGSGSADIDYDWVSGGNSGSAQYAYSWQTLGDGISYPLDGCPTGSMEFTFAPFRVVVEFNGTGTASYTMYNGSTMIPEGSGTEPLGCGIGR